jgi:acetylornithine/succinyldiaminopimelate/putrescine aminotransferase
MLGLPVREPYGAAAIVTNALFEQRLVLNAAGANTIRIVPPLIVSAEQVRDGVARLRAAVATLR